MTAMRYNLVTAVLYLLLCFLACLAQECQGAKSWADIVSSPSATTTTTNKKTPSNTKEATSSTVPPTQQSSPEIYKKLPRHASSHQVRNVYDGDTLTLVDERRVRLTGVDTPELEEKQAFAQQAKDYTKRYCHKQTIYLDVQGEDKYKRILAIVWVPLSDGTYLNVNEGLVSEGLASVYLADKKERPPNMKHLLKLQNTARTSRRGIWSTFVERNVVVTQYGAAYHLPTCRHLARSYNTNIIKASEAIDLGLHACRTCLPDEV